MDISVLQHAKDRAPRQMALDEVVELIRGDAWPAGYQPLAVMASVVSGGVMRKHIRWLTGLGIAHISHLTRQEAVTADNHTLLCYADGSGGCYVAYKYELNDGYSLDKQLRYYGRVQHWAADYYARLSGGEADRSCVGATKAVPLSRDPDVYYDDAAMPFMSADIDGADKSTEGLRERTPSWAERIMTLDEIDDYLVKHVELRRNVITSRMEIRWFADDIPRGLEPWKEFTDYEFNKLWRRMQRIKDVSERHLHQEIESDFSPDFHPFRDYLEHLPPWDGKADHIAILAAGVTVEGGEREQQSFCNCLKRWLVAMIAGWLTEDVVNQTVLVFIGRQGIYKTSWFKLLLPPQLRRYYYPRSNVKKSDKDAYTAMTQYGLIACEEQLVFRYFRKPTENESGELVDTAMALQVISYNVGPKIYPDKVDAAFADLGFEEMTVNGMSGYLAVRRKPEEIEALTRLMAQDAKQQSPKT